jgi:hypothetical protein
MLIIDALCCEKEAGPILGPPLIHDFGDFVNIFFYSKCNGYAQNIFTTLVFKKIANTFGKKWSKLPHIVFITLTSDGDWS